MMNPVARISSALGVVSSMAFSGAAFADNPLGFYVGAGIGESTIRSDQGFDPYYPTDSHPHHTAWKAFAGIRPLPFLGAEAEYIDFGHPGSADTYYGANYNADSHPKAGVLSAVGYLPLPYLDVFAKVGVARLETNLNTYTPGPCSQNVSGSIACAEYLSRQDVYETKVAYGAGVQTHFLGLAVRAEYERISSTYGDPDAVMVSATWTF
ncbi:MAG: OmpA-OmpF porin, family [Gammaproteobacteria bacterium]|nr:OmpA-OmpF porin, family [Gammaproteobacteria bacterium]